jgi:glycine C-acetyltransferase
MPQGQLQQMLAAELSEMQREGRLKGAETVFEGIVPPRGDFGPRYLLKGQDGREFLRMNSNGYLGLAMNEAVRDAEETAVRAMGTGPGAVRFISGTWSSHIALEQRLARFHDRGAGMIFSSAYAAMMGTLPPLISPETAVISDELNHNCIINAIRLARPKARYVYDHLDLKQLEQHLETAATSCRRALIVTDGIFSMRGDHAPLTEIHALARAYDDSFAEQVLIVVDDSHGVGAFGATGRGTEEHTGSGPADILLATLGKAFGVNGGYIVAAAGIIDYLRETSPFYIYSNPITAGEAAAADQAVGIVDSPAGRRLLDHLREMTARFQQGLIELGLETIAGDHPVVPLMIRDTEKTSALVRHLKENGILATGLNFPVVPKGDEEIRFQISADHTPADLQQALDVLAAFKG